MLCSYWMFVLGVLNILLGACESGLHVVTRVFWAF